MLRSFSLIFSDTFSLRFRYVYASISPLFDDGRSSVRSEKDIIQPALDSTMVMGLTAVTGTAALLLAVARTADWWQEW